MKKIKKIVHLLSALLLFFANIAVAQPVAFTNVTVIDVRDGVAKPAMTVVINGERITAVGPVRTTEIPVGTTVIDATGKYLIPGLWDMHVHSEANEITRKILLPLYVAHGVTGIREMSGTPDQLQLTKEIAEGKLLGPRMVVGSPLVDGPNPWPNAGPIPQVRVADPEVARKTVDVLRTQGYAFIKTYQFLSPQVYRALHQRAREVGFEISGEIPMSISLWEAAALGHLTVEHLTGIEIASSSKEEELRIKYRRQVADISADTTLRTHIKLWNRAEWEALESWDLVKAEALYRHLSAHKVWVVPTLIIQYYISYASDPAIQNDPRQRYLPEGWWDPVGTADYYDPNRKLRPAFLHRQRIVPDLHRSGVGILAGSDMAGGFPLHDELALFVKAGLSPLAALSTATINPAKYLKATDSLGTVEEGKLADLVLLDANPLDDITNTQKIHAVVVNGRFLDRQALDEMLAKAEQAANPQEVNKPKYKK